jgi:hypothetical protein
MYDFNYPVMHLHDEVLNISRDILEDEEHKLYRQAIIRPNTDLWHYAIEAEIDALQRNQTCDIVDRPIDRKIVDSNWVFKIKCFSARSVDKFKARLVAMKFSQIQGQDYDETLAPLVCFGSVRF